MSSLDNTFNSVFGSSIFGKGGTDEFMANIKEKAVRDQIAKEIEEQLKVNPEYTYKAGVIDSMVQELQKKIEELQRMKLEVKVEIANRILAAGGEKYKGYRFSVPPESSSIFGRANEPIVKKEETQNE